MLKDKRPSLRRMALETGFVLAQKSDPAAFERLLHIGAAAFDRHAHMWIVAISATHLAFQDRMMMWKFKTRPHFQMTLEARFRRSARIDNRVRRAAALDVQTTRPVARFAADVLGVLSLRLQSGMRCGPKIARDIFMTGLATLRADELRARDLGRR